MPPQVEDEKVRGQGQSMRREVLKWYGIFLRPSVVLLAAFTGGGCRHC